MCRGAGRGYTGVDGFGTRTAERFYPTLVVRGILADPPLTDGHWRGSFSDALED